MSAFDFLVIGGGIAGMSAAARLAEHGRVMLLEAEDAVGYHSSGRSATFYHFGIGNAAVRAMTSYSRTFFETPPPDMADEPLCRPTPALFVARPEMVGSLDALEREMRAFTDTIRRVDVPEMLEMVPVLRTGGDAIVAGVVDTSGRRLDPDRLLQGYARIVRRRGGTVETGARIGSVERRDGDWIVRTGRGDAYTGRVLVNAAGAWADVIAGMAGVRPLRLEPKRRTIIVFDPPEGVETRDWPFVKTAADEFYMLPEAGRLMASPVDEVPSAPADAQPEEFDLALAAWKVEEYTTMPVPRIQHRWAGLRTFTRDRVPTAGFAPDADGFFWLAGQGGYGLQTAPAMADIVAALATGGDWPHSLADLGLTPDQVRPERLLTNDGGADR